MNIQGWAKIALTLGLSVLIAWPLGLYLSRVWNDEKTWLAFNLAGIVFLYGLLRMHGGLPMNPQCVGPRAHSKTARSFPSTAQQAQGVDRITVHVHRQVVDLQRLTSEIGPWRSGLLQSMPSDHTACSRIHARRGDRRYRSDRSMSDRTDRRCASRSS